MGAAHGLPDQELEQEAHDLPGLLFLRGVPDAGQDLHGAKRIVGNESPQREQVAGAGFDDMTWPWTRPTPVWAAASRANNRMDARRIEM